MSGFTSRMIEDGFTDAQEYMDYLEMQVDNSIYVQSQDDDFLMCHDMIDPLEYLKGPNSRDFGTVFEYYKEETRRKRERMQKVQAIKNRIRDFWKMIFKNNSELTK